jgi:DHA2 family multidrug resistance protein-like MFS transporter
LLLPQAAAIIVASMMSTFLVRRIPAAYVVSGGLAVTALGLVILTQVGTGNGLTTIIIGSVILGIGVAPAATLSTDLIIGAAPPERAGAASAISETGGELGNALGIAILGSIGIAVYRGAMADGVPAAVPPVVADSARGTFAGAVTTARDLPAGSGAELLDNARTAFTSGLHLSAGLGAAAAAAAAIAAVLLLRPRNTSGQASR